MKAVFLVLALLLAGCGPWADLPKEKEEVTGSVHARWYATGNLITEFTPVTAPDMLCILVSHYGVYCFPKDPARK